MWALIQSAGPLLPLQDPQLAWEKGEYGGVESIRLPPDLVWVPDIVLYNNADGKYEV